MRGWSDDDVVVAVAELRARTGVCSYRSLASILGLSVTGAKGRVDRLVRGGRLLNGPEAGAIRLNIPPEVMREVLASYLGVSRPESDAMVKAVRVAARKMTALVGAAVVV